MIKINGHNLYQIKQLLHEYCLLALSGHQCLLRCVDSWIGQEQRRVISLLSLSWAKIPICTFAFFRGGGDSLNFQLFLQWMYAHCDTQEWNTHKNWEYVQKEDNLSFSDLPWRQLLIPSTGKYWPCCLLCHRLGQFSLPSSLLSCPTFVHYWCCPYTHACAGWRLDGGGRLPGECGLSGVVGDACRREALQLFRLSPILLGCVGSLILMDCHPYYGWQLLSCQAHLCSSLLQ